MGAALAVIEGMLSALAVVGVWNGYKTQLVVGFSVFWRLQRNAWEIVDVLLRSI